MGSVGRGSRVVSSGARAPSLGWLQLLCLVPQLLWAGGQLHETSCTIQPSPWPAGAGAQTPWIDMNTNAHPGCPTGWITQPSVGDSCYFFSQTATNATTAAQHCQAAGGNLVTVRDQGVQSFLVQHASGQGRYWIGAQRSGGQLSWAGGQSPFTNWASGNPGFTSGCASLCSQQAAACSAGQWMVDPCNSTDWRYICSRPSSGVRRHDNLSNPDDGFVDVELRFPFRYFSRTLNPGDVVRASTNGYITFGVGSALSQYGSTRPIPHDGPPYGQFAVYWADLDTRNRPGAMLSRSTPSQLVIEWSQMPFWIRNRAERCAGGQTAVEAGCFSTATFQSILYPNGTIWASYLDCDIPPSASTHAPLRIGYQNYDGSTAYSLTPAPAGIQGQSFAIDGSCHVDEAGCAAQVSNSSASCGLRDDVSRVQDSPTAAQELPETSWQWALTIILTMVFISVTRLCKVVCHGHWWNGVFIDARIEIDLRTLSARRSRGLSRSELESLPQFQFQTNAEHSPEPEPSAESGQSTSGSTRDSLSQPTSTYQGPSNHDSCAICMTNFDDDSATSANENLLQLQCGHVFHRECVTPWLQRHRDCPICKQDAGNGPVDPAPAAANEPPAMNTAQLASLRARVRAGCDRGAVVISSAGISGLLIHAMAEMSYHTYCEELSLRCGFFIAVAFFSSGVTTMAAMTLYWPSGFWLGDGLIGYSALSFSLLSAFLGWGDHIAAESDDSTNQNVDNGENVNVATTNEILNVWLRFFVGLTGILFLCAARERRRSITAYLIASNVQRRTQNNQTTPTEEGTPRAEP